MTQKRRNTHMIDRFTNWLLKWRWLVLLVMCAIVFACAMGTQHLRFSTDYRMFFSKDNPNLVAFEALQNTYTKQDNILFVLSPKDKQVFKTSTLQAIQWLTEASWQIPYSIRVDSVTNYQHTQAQGDDLYVDDLIADGFSFEAKDLEKQKAIALSEPDILKRLLSSDGSVTGVNVTIQLPDEDLEKAQPQVVAFSRNLRHEFQQAYPDIDIKLTGIVMQNAAFTEASMHDLQTLVPVMLALIILGVGFFMRNIGAIICVVTVIFASVIAAMGIAGYLGIKLSPATTSAPTVIMTLAVADCVHLMSTFYWRLRHGDNKAQALAYSMKLNVMPIFLTSFTTMFGFLSLNFSDAPPFRDLGNVVAMGVMIAFFLTITVAAVLLSMMPAAKMRRSDHLQAGLDYLAEKVIRHPKAFIGIFSTVIVACLLFIPKNQLNDEWISYFSERTAFRQSTDYTLDNLTGLGTIQYSIDAKGSEGIYDPDYMRTLDVFTKWLAQQPEVVQVSSVTNVIKKLNKAMHGDDPNWFRIPDDRALLAQYLLLYELSLPRGLDLNNQINVDKSATRVQVVLKKISTNTLLKLEKRVQSWMQDNLPEHMITPGTSPDIMFAHIGFKNIRNLLGGSVLALLLISVVLCLAFRSIKFGAFSVLPNLLPIGVSFGIWGVLVGEVGLGLSVVAGLTLGIVVDDTIHFLSKYRYARLASHTPEEAVRYAFSSVGKALLVTSIVLVCGFLIFTLSDFKLNSSMGLLTALTIALALIIDFCLVPPLLLILEGKSHALLGTHSQPNSEHIGLCRDT